MRDSYLLWSSGGFNSFTPHQSVFRQMDAILYVCVPAMFLFPLTTQPHRHFHWNVMRSRLNISLYIGPCSPFTHDPSQETFPNIYEWTAWLKVAIDCIYSYPYPQQTTATRDQMWFFKFFCRPHLCLVQCIHPKEAPLHQVSIAKTKHSVPHAAMHVIQLIIFGDAGLLMDLSLCLLWMALHAE